MKILFLAPQPFFEERGTPINVKLVLKALSDLGHTVTLVTLPFGSSVTIPNVTIKRLIKIPGVGKPRPGPSWQKMVYDLVMLVYVFFHRLFHRYDALHGVEEAVFIGLFVRKIFATPYIFDMDSHMSDQLRYSKFSKNENFLSFFGWLETVTLKNATAVVTVCQYLTDVAREHVHDEKIFQIEDIPQEFPLSAEDISAYKLRVALGIDPEAPVALYAGNFEKYQGIDLLMEAIPLVADKAKEARFVIVGGAEEEVARYRRMAHDLRVADQVIFTGRKPLAHMPYYYEMADILVSPRLEGTNTPMKVYTYLATGKAVLATDLPTHTQLLNTAIAELAPPEKVAFAEALLLLLKESARRNEIGRNGAAFVAERFTYETFRDKLATAYRAIG